MGLKKFDLAFIVAIVQNTLEKKNCFPCHINQLFSFRETFSFQSHYYLNDFTVSIDN